LKRFFRYYFLRFKRLQGQPEIIARGIAIGLFIGITPTIPLHTILLLALCFPLRASKVAALLASVIICNPVTLFLQYYLCWQVGSLFFPGLLSWEKMQQTLVVLSHSHGYEGFRQSMIAISLLGVDAAIVMLTGGLVIAVPVTLLGYYYSLKFFRKLRKKKNS
jgi:uncharacterized protein (DUF2062 family)